ncbi:MAG: hypothetical protein KA761_00230 [Gemmatimonadaceae bacterium]|nr:hypothetical protein [Gemmatimonadaceae bacterium]
MPQLAIAAAAYAGAAAATGGAVIGAAGVAGTGLLAGVSYAAVAGYAAMLVSSVGFAAHDRRKARDQADASLQDRLFPINATDEPKKFVYGRMRVGGLRTYAANHGEKREKVSFVYAYAGHEVDAFEEIWANDKSAGPWSVSSGLWTATGSSSYVLSAVRVGAHAANGGSAGLVVTLPVTTGDLVGVDTVALIGAEYVPSVDGIGTYQQTERLLGATEFSVSTNTVTVNVSSVDTRVIVSYRYLESSGAFLEVRPFVGMAAGERDTGLEGYTSGDTAPWTLNHLGKNIARARFTHTYQETIYANGLPNPTAILRGKKVYDPRDGTQSATTPSTWKFSRNPALIVADYLMDPYGFGCASTRIDWPSVTTAANVCDEYVPLDIARSVTAITKEPQALVTCPGHTVKVGQEVQFSVTGMTGLNTGRHTVVAVNSTEFRIATNTSAMGTFTGGTAQPQQVRYTCDGELSTGTPRRQNLEDLLTSMIGSACYTGGKWIVRAAAYVTPELDLDQDDLIEAPRIIQTRLPKDQVFNCVRGTFRDPDRLWQVDGFEPYESSTYISADNGRKRWKDIALPFTTDNYRAQRIAKLILFRARNALTLEATFTISAYKLTPGDTVRLSIAKWGWTLKEFRVVDRQFAGMNAIKLVLQEEASAFYAWDYSEKLDPIVAPNTSLPDPRYVPPITGVTIQSNESTFYVRKDGTIAPYVLVGWDPPPSDDIRVEIQWKLVGEVEYRKEPLIEKGVTSFRIEGVPPGSAINLFLRGVNSIGAVSRSAWVSSFVVSADSPSPRAVSVTNLLQVASLNGDPGPIKAYTFNAGGAAATFTKHPTMYVPGTPSSMYLATASGLTGGGRALFSDWPFVGGIIPGARYAAYCGLIPWDSDGYISIIWYGQNLSGSPIKVDYTSVVAGVPAYSVAWEKPENYRLSSGIFTAPPGAAAVLFRPEAGGNWTAAPAKYMSLYRPFFGEVPQGVNTLPPWDVGGQNVVGTSLLAAEAATTSWSRLDETGVVVSAVPIVSKGISVDALLQFPDTILSTASGALEVKVTFSIGVTRGADSQPRRILAYLGRNFADPTIVGVQHVIATTSATTEDVFTQMMEYTFSYTAGETVRPFIALIRESLTAGPARVTKSMGGFSTTGNNATDRILGANWSINLIKK